jgi:hypothetical protein
MNFKRDGYRYPLSLAELVSDKTRSSPGKTAIEVFLLLLAERALVRRAAKT